MLETLTQPNYPKAALGLEQESVTALALQKEGRGRFGIRQAATLDLPVNLLVPSFTEHNISSPNEMLILLEEVTATAGLRKQKRWSVSLSVQVTERTTVGSSPRSKSAVKPSDCELINSESALLFASASQLASQTARGITKPACQPSLSNKVSYSSTTLNLTAVAK